MEGQGEGGQEPPPASPDERQEEIARAVRELIRSGAVPEIASLPTSQELAEEEKKQELGLKGTYGYVLLGMMGAQLLIANGVFVAYAWAGTHPAWHVDPNVMKVWLGATVIQVIGVVYVVTRNLFPRRDI